MNKFLMLVLACLSLSAHADPLESYYSGLDRRCSVDTDCAIMNIGNCCGREPACLAKFAKPNPAWVQKQCEKHGLAGVCGFTPVMGCQCKSGRCASLSRIPN